MSDILIKGMEMPKYCDIDCPIFPDSICPVKTIIEMKELGDNRHPNCPLVPVPPHRRLIDGDEFLHRAIGTKCFRGDYALMLEELVGESSTIIEAEEGE